MHHQWTSRCIEEFFVQGDREAEMGLEFSPLCDRNNTMVPQSQIGRWAVQCCNIGLVRGGMSRFQETKLIALFSYYVCLTAAAEVLLSYQPSPPMKMCNKTL